jgi:hypothetical protein
MTGQPEYTATVSHRSGFSNRLASMRFYIRIERDGRYVASEYVGRLSQVRPAIRKVVWRDMVDRNIGAVTRTFDFEDAR